MLTRRSAEEAREVVEHTVLTDGSNVHKIDVRAAMDVLFSVLGDPSLRFYTPRHGLVQSCVYEAGVLFDTADGRHMGILWYVNDQ